MVLLRRIRNEDAELLLRGRALAPDRASDLEHLVAFLDVLRAAVPAAPPPSREAPLVERLSAAALEADHRVAAAPRQPMRSASAIRMPVSGGRLALAAKVAAAVALLPAAMAGLAFAGVTLPEPAREAMQRIGLELPNQSAVEGEPTARGDDADANGGAPTQARPNAASSARGGTSTGESAKPAPRRRSQSEGGAPNPNADGQPGHGSEGQGTPQLGEPAPITPPGQGGTPPGQGGPSPSQAKPQSETLQGTGPSGGTPPGQASQGE